MRRAFVLALCLALTAAHSPAISDEQPAKVPELSGIASYGQDLYQGRCSNCHSNRPGENSLAPTLHGLFGRKAGSIPDFPYSEKITKLELVWAKDSFDAWIASQSLDSAQLRMRHLGVENVDDRQALIAYIETLKD